MHMTSPLISETLDTNTIDIGALWPTFRLDPDQNMASVICQWFFQATILLLTQRLLYSNLKADKQLHCYVLGVNTMCLLHTLIRTTLAFYYIHDTVEAYAAAGVSATILPVMITFETMVIQAYFLFRCWNILNKRKWAMAPLLVLWILSGIAGICFAGVSGSRPRMVMAALAVWIALSLSLDIIMTVITILYLIRQKREYSVYTPVLVTIWNMLWLAAIPPMIAMIALMLAVYVFNSGSWGTFIYDISSKLFVLSLLVALAGRERAANKLKRATQMELDPVSKDSFGRLSD
ncbi:hypothetical protein ACGC1H_006019 [Rhizoctonia solani]|uniref:Transmembrane protein n=1 Tax=Rhizoctonia solani TaxID=456999 RepID=A0A8H3H108_9AGAM|nr:unnamed protein product [Rhizoctonia solani]